MDAQYEEAQLFSFSSLKTPLRKAYVAARRAKGPYNFNRHTNLL